MPIISTDQTITIKENKSYLFPLILVTSLFFLWGFAYGLLDVLNKHFQVALNVTKQRSTLLQAAYFGAYFLMALPAGFFMKKWGYKNGILVGLFLYSVGAMLFYPAASNADFSFFLLALFILASGLTFLETAANPYVTVLGAPENASWRLNLSQSFNGVGSFLGPIIGGMFFFSGDSSNLDSVQVVYLLMSAVVMVIFFLFWRTHLPEINSSGQETAREERRKPLWQRHFIFAVVSQFFYVAAQVGIAALFLNYCSEEVSMSDAKGSFLLSAGLFLFTVGRFIGTALMKFVESPKLLAIYAAVNILLCVVVIQRLGDVSIYALVGTFFFNSIMFPTIFALGVKGLGDRTKEGASLLIMAIVGGAIVPYVMGSFAITANAFITPLLCYVVVFLFGVYGHKPKSRETSIT